MKLLTRRKSVRRLIFGLLSLLPILMILLACFRSGTFDITSVDQSLSTFSAWPLIGDFYSWLCDTFFDGFTNDWLHLCVVYFVYLMAVTCLDLFFGFFFAVLDLFRGFLDRLGGDL